MANDLCINIVLVLEYSSKLPHLHRSVELGGVLVLVLVLEYRTVVRRLVGDQLGSEEGASRWRANKKKKKIAAFTCTYPLSPRVRNMWHKQKEGG